MNPTFPPQAAYIVHWRLYRETSMLIDVFSQMDGIVPMVCKGVQRPKGLRRLIRQFSPLWVTWRGRRDLKTMTALDARGTPYFYNDITLYSAMYINELLFYTVPKYENHSRLFKAYEKVLHELNDGQLEVALRRFEFTLLDEIGYGLNWDVVSEGYYRYEYYNGLTPCNHNTPNHFAADVLRAMHSGDYSQRTTRQAAKNLVRIVLHGILKGQTLHSRALCAGQL